MKIECTPPAQSTGQGIKHDQGKDRWSLLPWDAVQGIVKVLVYGANKYSSRNWEAGMDWDRPYDALMRHLTDWYHQVDKGKGPGRDADTGYSDLWHAGCNVLFLIAFELRGTGRDTRPNVQPITDEVSPNE
jgi:hypothetical protein